VGEVTNRASGRKTAFFRASYTNSNIERAIRIRHRRTNMMMNSKIRKIIHSRRRNTTAIITKSYSNILTDCDDDKTLVILLELRPHSQTCVEPLGHCDVLDASGTTKLLDEELLETAAE
jgi:hypothetical protein